MNGQKRPLGTNEPVGLEEYTVGIQYFEKISDHFKGFYKIYHKLIKENHKITMCNQLDMETLRF